MTTDTAAPGTIVAGTIVVGIDGSDPALHALSWAADQAVLEHRSITLVCGVGVSTPAWPSGSATLPLEYREALRAEARAALVRARGELARHTPELEVHHVVETADPRSLLIGLSERAAMVVLGSRGHGPVGSLLLGSVGVALSRHAACPVVIHRPSEHGLVRRGVVVGADATAASRTVLEAAYRQASLRSLPLRVLHCFWDALAAANAAPDVLGSLDYQEERAMLAESLAGLGEKYPDVNVHTDVAHGEPAKALVEAGRLSDLLVVGAHQAQGPQWVMFGSVSVSVVEHARCPVLVVPVRAEQSA